MSARRAPRPRYGRLAALTSSLAVTLVSVLGGLGSIPVGARADLTAASSPAQLVGAPGAGVPRGRPAELKVPATAPDTGAGSGPGSPALPPGSGTGRRVVFSESAQRVWLVGSTGEVVDTWLVSGSLTDNLQPGTYAVWSRSEQAWGIDDSGTMRYFVRFAHGERAAIGFHDIPVDDGELVQGFDELGTPQSHGCIRQRRADARRMWDFAGMGTTVVVTA